MASITLNFDDADLAAFPDVGPEQSSRLDRPLTIVDEHYSLTPPYYRVKRLTGEEQRVTLSGDETILSLKQKILDIFKLNGNVSKCILVCNTFEGDKLISSKKVEDISTLFVSSYLTKSLSFVIRKD